VYHGQGYQRRSRTARRARFAQLLLRCLVFSVQTKKVEQDLCVYLEEAYMSGKLEDKINQEIPPSPEFETWAHVSQLQYAFQSSQKTRKIKKELFQNCLLV
jgi:hypothetical protein